MGFWPVRVLTLGPIYIKNSDSHQHVIVVVIMQKKWVPTEEWISEAMAVFSPSPSPSTSNQG